jgi:hypothetical protein
MSAADPCELSVIVASHHHWPAAQPCLEALAPQLAALGGRVELLVLVAEPDGITDEELATRPYARRLVFPEASVFRLRLEGVRAARGAIVAITEDHCVPAADWVEQTLRAHREFPLAGVIGGAVTNDSTATAAMRASFLMTFSEYHPPLPERPGQRVPLAANLSFKRWALPREGELPEGYLELQHIRGLMDQDLAALWGDSVVLHVQPYRRLESLVVHFHNGRTTTGLLAESMNEEELAKRRHHSLRQPALTLEQLRHHASQKPGVAAQLDRFTRLWVACLAWSHCLGEMVGLVTRSAGNSPSALE